METKYDRHVPPLKSLIDKLNVYQSMIAVKQKGQAPGQNIDGYLPELQKLWDAFVVEAKASHGEKAMALSAGFNEKVAQARDFMQQHGLVLAAADDSTAELATDSAPPGVAPDVAKFAAEHGLVFTKQQ